MANTVTEPQPITVILLHESFVVAEIKTATVAENMVIHGNQTMVVDQLMISQQSLRTTIFDEALKNYWLAMKKTERAQRNVEHVKAQTVPPEAQSLVQERATAKKSADYGRVNKSVSEPRQAMKKSEEVEKKVENDRCSDSLPEALRHLDRQLEHIGVGSPIWQSPSGKAWAAVFEDIVLEKRPELSMLGGPLHSISWATRLAPNVIGDFLEEDLVSVETMNLKFHELAEGLACDPHALRSVVQWHWAPEEWDAAQVRPSHKLLQRVRSCRDQEKKAAMKRRENVQSLSDKYALLVGDLEEGKERAIRRHHSLLSSVRVGTRNDATKTKYHTGPFWAIPWMRGGGLPNERVHHPMVRGPLAWLVFSDNVDDWRNQFPKASRRDADHQTRHVVLRSIYDAKREADRCLTQELGLLKQAASSMASLMRFILDKRLGNCCPKSFIVALQMAFSVEGALVNCDRLPESFVQLLRESSEETLRNMMNDARDVRRTRMLKDNSRRDDEIAQYETSVTRSDVKILIFVSRTQKNLKNIDFCKNMTSRKSRVTQKFLARQGVEFVSVRSEHHTQALSLLKRAQMNAKIEKILFLGKGGPWSSSIRWFPRLRLAARKRGNAWKENLKKVENRRKIIAEKKAKRAIAEQTKITSAAAETKVQMSCEQDRPPIESSGRLKRRCLGEDLFETGSMSSRSVEEDGASQDGKGDARSYKGKKAMEETKEGLQKKRNIVLEQRSKRGDTTAGIEKGPSEIEDPGIPKVEIAKKAKVAARWNFSEISQRYGMRLETHEFPKGSLLRGKPETWVLNPDYVEGFLHYGVDLHDVGLEENGDIRLPYLLLPSPSNCGWMATWHLESYAYMLLKSDVEEDDSLACLVWKQLKSLFSEKVDCRVCPTKARFAWRELTLQNGNVEMTKVRATQARVICKGTGSGLKERSTRTFKRETLATTFHEHDVEVFSLERCYAFCRDHPKFFTLVGGPWSSFDVLLVKELSLPYGANVKVSARKFAPEVRGDSTEKPRVKREKTIKESRESACYSLNGHQNTKSFLHWEEFIDCMICEEASRPIFVQKLKAAKAAEKERLRTLKLEVRKPSKVPPCQVALVMDRSDDEGIDSSNMYVIGLFDHWCNDDYPLHHHDCPNFEAVDHVFLELDQLLQDCGVNAVALRGKMAQFHGRHRLPIFLKNGGRFVVTSRLHAVIEQPVEDVMTWAIKLSSESASVDRKEVEFLRVVRRRDIASTEYLEVLEKALLGAWKLLGPRDDSVFNFNVSIALENDELIVLPAISLCFRRLLLYIAHVVGERAGSNKVYVSSVLNWLRNSAIVTDLSSLEKLKERVLNLSEPMVISRKQALAMSKLL